MNEADRIERWRAAWPQALAVWSRYTRLHDPRLCASSVEAAREGLSGSFAMIRLLDQSVVIDLQQTAALGLDDHALEILAHEIGHHVLAPATATDQYRLLARIRRALPTLEQHAPMVANLYTDLFINDRLQRQAGLRIADIYRRLAAGRAAGAPVDGVWALYMGIYEQLWQLDPGSLGGPTEDARLRTDAWLGARVVRVYAGDWLTAAGRFASLLLPYLASGATEATLHLLQDTRDAAQGCDPVGAQTLEGNEIDGAIHPAEDVLVTGEDPDRVPPPLPVTLPVLPGDPRAQTRGQAREPFEYGEILRAAGITLSDHDIAVRYYRERALPHLVRFPTRPQPDSDELQLEGLEPWELGDALDEVDWLQSVVQSPTVVPGLTTVRRVYGREPSTDTPPIPVDLDLYVDSSGSMPDPQQHTSWPALAGAVIALSALRVGARVQVTLWSGKHQVTRTSGFVRDEDAILRVLTGFYGGGTTFPIHCLRETYAQRAADARAVHLLQISDDGISTMFEDDEQGDSGWTVAANAMARAGGGGTMALNIPAAWLSYGARAPTGLGQVLHRAQQEQGWDIHAIEKMDDLLAFARAFSRRHYSADAASNDRHGAGAAAR